MLISELIAELHSIKAVHGDVRVIVQGELSRNPRPQASSDSAHLYWMQDSDEDARPEQGRTFISL